jgi:hypothetical protein
LHSNRLDKPIKEKSVVFGRPKRIITGENNVSVLTIILGDQQ